MTHESSTATEVIPDVGFSTAHDDVEVQPLGDLATVLRSALSNTSSDAEKAQRHLELALALGLRGDAEGALEAARAAHRLQPSVTTARAWRETAMRLRPGVEWIRALELELALELPVSARAPLEIARGRALEAAGDSAGAAAAFARAAELRPDVEAAWAAERVFVRGARWREAAAHATKVAEACSDPELIAEFASRAARYCARAGDLEAAERSLALAQEHAPSAPGTALAAELVAAASGATALWCALRHRQAARNLVPRAEALIDAGLLAGYAAGDAEAAQAAFEKALPETSGALRSFVLREISTSLDPIADPDRWCVAMRERIETEPSAAERTELRYRVALTRADLCGDSEGAAELLRAVLAEDPLHAGAIALCERLGGTPEGIDLADVYRREAAAASHPSQRAPASACAARLLADRGELAAAAELIREAAIALPADPGVLLAAERILSCAADWAGLRDAYARALEHAQSPVRRFWLLTRIASVAARLGDPAPAQAALREAARIEVSAPLAAGAEHARLLMSAEGGGDAAPDEVLEHLVTLTEDPSEAAVYASALAEAREQRGDLEGASAGLLSLLSLPALPAHVVRVASRVLGRAERHGELLTLGEAALQSARGEERVSWLCRTAAVLGWELDQPAEALRRLREAQALAPGDERVWRAIRDELERAGAWQELELHLRAVADPYSHLRRGALLEAVGKAGDALLAYETALAAGVEVARAPRARLLMQLGRWEELERESARWSGGPREAVVTARCLAAVLAMEQNGDLRRAVESAEEAVALAPDALAPKLLLLAALGADDERRPGHLRAISDLASDPALSRPVDRELAHLASRSNRRAWLEIAMSDPNDPIAFAEALLGLEAEGDARSIVDLLRALERAEPACWASTEPMRTLHLAQRCRSLGSQRAAADAFEAALTLPGRPLTAYLELPRLYSLLDAGAQQDQALEMLAARLPTGPLAARVHRALAERLRERGEDDLAISVLEHAVEVYPGDYGALRLLEATCRASGTMAPCLDAMRRTLEVERDIARIVELGTHLGRLLCDEKKWELAREVLERVVSSRPDHRAAQLWLAELCERTADWARLNETLKLMSGPDGATGLLLNRALRRRVEVALYELGDLGEASRAALELGGVAPDDPLVLETTLATARAEENHARAVAVLKRLTSLPGIGESMRVGYLFELATLQAEKLGDAAAAIRALGGVTTTEGKSEAARRLLTLGERSGRWDLASEALESALDSPGVLEPSWEATLRRRLAELFDGPLERPDAALRQYRRIIELDPEGAAVALERLAELTDDDEERFDILRHRFALRPSDAGLLRELRRHAIEVDDADSAFCMEAVAVGLGIATEEEEYFYRQRRSFLGNEPPARCLGEDEIAALVPAAQRPAARLLAAMAPVIGAIFPVDFGAYGVRPGSPGGVDTLLVGHVTRVAGSFGLECPLLCPVAARLGPTVEYHEGRPVLLLPRSMEELPPREQGFILGALCYRIASGAGFYDPARANALQPVIVGYLLDAVLRIADGTDEPVDNPVLKDIERRMRPALDADLRDRIAGARAALGAVDRAAIDAVALVRAQSAAAGKAGMLVARDPAVAIAAMRTWSRMFARGGDAAQAGELSPACWDVVAFGVSRQHRDLRTSLGLGVKR